MPTDRKQKTVAGKATRTKRRMKKVFDPFRPFAEGVRGVESFYIQDGFEFPKTGLPPKGFIDG